MSIIFIEVSTPGNTKQYEFMIEDTLLIKDAINKLYYQISQLEQEQFDIDKDKFILYSMTHKKPLGSCYSLRQQGVKSGNRLLLV